MGRDSPGYDPSLSPGADDGEVTRTYRTRAAAPPSPPPYASTEALPHPPTEVGAAVVAPPPGQGLGIVRYGPGVPATPAPGQAGLTAERAWHGTTGVAPPARRRERWRRQASAALTIALLAA